MKRPLFWMGNVFLSTTAAFCIFPVPTASFAGIGAALLAVWLCDAKRKRGALLAFLLCALAAAALFAGRTALWSSRFGSLIGQEFTVELTVSSRSFDGRRFSLEGRGELTLPDGETIRFGGDAYRWQDTDVFVGDRLRAVALVEDGNPADGLQLEILELLPTETSPASPYAALLRLRRQGCEEAAARTGGEAGGLLAALLTGDRSLLDGYVSDSLRTAGLSHLIAVSGLHLSIVAAAVLWLWRRESRTRSLGVIALCWLFAAFCGLTPSIVRAAVMLSLMQLAPFFSRRSDGLTSLAFAGWALALADPFSMASPSMTLSYLATLGILLLAEPIEQALLKIVPLRLRETAAAGWLANSLAVSAAAQLAAAPVLLVQFGCLTTWGLLINLIAIPLVTLLLPLGWIMLLCGSIPAAASVTAAVCRALALLLIRLSALTASLPFAQIGFSERYQYCWMAAAILSVLWLCARRPKAALVTRTLLLLGCALLASANLSALLRRNTAEVLYLQDSQAILVSRQNRGVLLGAPAGSGQETLLIDAMARLGVRQLDAVIVSDAAELNPSAASLAHRFDAVLAAPDGIGAASYCMASGLSLVQLPADGGAVYGVPVHREGGAVIFSFGNGSVLKSARECAIIDPYPRRLPSMGRRTARHRFTLPDDEGLPFFWKKKDKTKENLAAAQQVKVFGSTFFKKPEITN